MKRFRRWLFNGLAAMSLLLLVAMLVCWHRGSSYPNVEQGFDLVHWDGTDDGFLDYGLACHMSYGLLDVKWVRLRGGFDARGVANEADAIAAVDPGNEYMPGVGDSRAFNVGPPHRWNWTDHVWDFNVPRSEPRDTHRVLVETRWGLRAAVENYEWDTSWNGGIFWERCTFHILRVPIWLIATISALTPVVWLCVKTRQVLMRTRLWPGFCAACGYDLRATPDRCPECGTIPLKKEIISS
jgi:hypothetical protein